MRQILEIEDHVAVPPMMYSDPFYKWFEGEKGRPLSWPEARTEWTRAHRVEFEKFLIETMSFPDTSSVREAKLSAEKAVARTGVALSTLPRQ